MESVEMNKRFWQGKKVFITGHTGFKGAWLAFWLRSLGAQVCGYALPPPTEPNLYEVLNLENDVESFFGDIRNLDLLRKQLLAFDPEIVVHMAAQAIVRESYRNPVETFEVNIIGTANLLEVIRDARNVRAVVCVTSDKCYENQEWIWKYRENDSLGGWDPYSASKGCSELVIASYRNSFFTRERYDDHHVAIASVRAGNVIGGGDWGKDRLIPDIVRAFSQNKRVIIRNPVAIRPWQFVLDLLWGYLLLAERLYNDGPNYMEAWNFGPNENEEKTVLDMVCSISTIWGNGAEWEIDQTGAIHPHEALTLRLDSSKARSRLGWMPRLTLEQSLRFIVDWYKQFYFDRQLIREFSSQQLTRYEEFLQKSTLSYNF